MKLRANLDRQEAESEQKAESDPGAYTVKFGEHFRKGLEKIADHFNRPLDEIIEEYDQREAKRFLALQKTLADLLSSAPTELRCAADTMAFPEDRDHHLTVYFRDQNQQIHKLCEVVTADRWPQAIDKAKARPPVPGSEKHLEVLEHLASTPVTTEWVTVGVDCLEESVVEQATRAWLSEFAPDLAQIPISWVSVEERDAFVSDLTKQRFVRSVVNRPELLDELMEAIQDLDDYHGESESG